MVDGRCWVLVLWLAVLCIYTVWKIKGSHGGRQWPVSLQVEWNARPSGEWAGAPVEEHCEGVGGC